MSALSDLISASNTEGLSARLIARTARLRGYTLNHDTAARYLRGAHGSPDEATLNALADVLQIPLVELRKAANLPSEETEPYVPPLEANRLSRRQRKAVDEIIRAMLDTSSRDAARSGPKAARRGDPEPPA